LSDALLRHHDALEELDGLSELIDWKAIEKQLSGLHSKNRGEQA